MKKNNCRYCGNNPVPHFFYWFGESLNILLNQPRQKFLYNPLTRFLAKKQWTGFLERLFLALGEALGIVKRQNDSKFCKVRRARVLWEEAEKRGTVMGELLLFGKPIDAYIAEKFEIRNSKFETNPKSKILNLKSKILFSGLPRPAGYSNHWLDLMDDKWLFKRELLKNYLPVPIGASCGSYSQAKKIFDEIRNPKSEKNIKSEILNLKPVIVKPRAGSRGRHSTTFVFTEDDLKKAVGVAQKLCHWVMVEEQLFGPVYRATVIGGKLAGVLRGDPPQVVGDGQHNIGQLISIKNSQPHPGVKDIVADDGVVLFLSRQNLKLSSVPQKGQVVNISEKIGVNYGGSSSEDYEICHPDNKQLFLRAAEIFGDPIVGFDFIIPDIAASWRSQKCGFIEANSLPFINLHHDPLLGTPRNAAALVWDMLG